MKRNEIKLDVVSGGVKVTVVVDLISNKPLICVDENSLNSNVLISSDKMVEGFTPPPKLNYTLSTVHKDKFTAVWDDTVQHGGTYISHYTKAPHDILYIPQLSQFISIPNVHNTLSSGGYNIKVEGFSIGGKTQSTVEHVNLNTLVTDNDKIVLGNITGMVFNTKLLSLPGSVKHTDIDPNMHTIYLDGGVGEIMVGNSTPIYTMFITVDNVVFTEEHYNSSVLTPKSLHRYGLEHYEGLAKPSTYMVVLG